MSKTKAAGPTVGTLTQEINLLKNRLKSLEGTNKDLVKKNEDFEKRIVELESFRQASSHVTDCLKEENDRLREQLDSVDQYGRRANIIIKHMPCSDTERDNPGELHEKVSQFLTKDLKLPHAPKDIDKLHRTGKPKTYNGTKQQNIIVRFKTHATRYSVYRKRNETKKYKVCPNLTRLREKTLYDAEAVVADIPDVNFVYADIHGDMKVRFKNKMEDREAYKFDSIKHLIELLKRFKLYDEDDGEEE